MPNTVLICDDHDIVRAGLKLIIESDAGFRVVGAVSSGEELIAMVDQLQPDIVITDLSMPGMGGLAAIARVKAVRPQVRVLTLTIHEDESYFFRALEAGAEGYVLKGASADELLAALRLLEHGGVPVPRQLGNALLADYLSQPRSSAVSAGDPLSSRERDVLRLLAEGQTNKEIAQRLSLGVRTVERVRAAIMESAGLQNRVELLSYARRHGLLGPGRPE
jgi:two-component system response regulator NreC